VFVAATTREDEFTEAVAKGTEVEVTVTGELRRSVGVDML
jgi:hypothetical protein